MNHTENKTMYVVDYECGSSSIHEFMNGKDLKALETRAQEGSVRITNLVCLGNSTAG